MTNSWFRLYAEFSTDPKVQMLSEADQRRYIMLLCMRCGNGGVTLQDDEVAFQLRISNEQWAATKATLQAKGLIDVDALPMAWDKRQYVSDSSSARVAAYREKKKRERNVTVTPPDTDTDTEESKALAPDARTPAPKKKSSKFDPLTARPANVSEAAWADWCAHRKQKSAMTAKACELIANKLATHHDPEAVLYRSIENGWTGIFPEQVTHEASPSTRGTGRLSAVDAVKHAIATREAAEAQPGAAGQAVAEDGGAVRTALDGEFRRVG